MVYSIQHLAQLYLRGEPQQVSEQTSATLCNWIFEQFQCLPFAVLPSDYMHYDSAAEMAVDIEAGYLYEATDIYNIDYLPGPFCGFALLAVHDYDHYLTQSEFNLPGEIETYKAVAHRSPTLAIQKILYCEFVLKPAAYLYLGHPPNAKLVFP